MSSMDLARAYVALDRFAFFHREKYSALQNLCATAEQRLRENDGLTDFETLCDAGAEDGELLWLLGGYGGLPGFIRNRTLEIFGWSPPQLTRGLAAIEKAASVIEKIQSHPFGLLARHAGAATCPHKDHLRSYVTLARAARSDFRRSEWFRNIAKARLVIHVTHRTKGAPHDKEISGLIAAISHTDYNAGAQCRWRQTHGELFRDASLDPYTVMGQARREDVRQSWKMIATSAPEFFSGFDKWMADYEALLSRLSKLANR